MWMFQTRACAREVVLQFRKVVVMEGGQGGPKKPPFTYVDSRSPQSWSPPPSVQQCGGVEVGCGVGCRIVLSVLLENLPQADADEEMFEFFKHAKKDTDCEQSLWHHRLFACQILGVW